MHLQPVEPQVLVRADVVQPKPTVGVATILGVGLAVLGALGTVAAAIAANDTATVTAGAAGMLAALTTIGGRMAQAVALARRLQDDLGPIVDAVQAALERPDPPDDGEDPEADAVAEHDLPTDEDEAAAPPPDNPDGGHELDGAVAPPPPGGPAYEPLPPDDGPQKR